MYLSVSGLRANKVLQAHWSAFTLQREKPWKEQGAVPGLTGGLQSKQLPKMMQFLRCDSFFFPTNRNILSNFIIICAIYADPTHFTNY